MKIVIELTPETSVPVKQLKDILSCFQNLKSPHAWTGRFRGSPAKWNIADGEAVVKALEDAKKNPIIRPIDPKALKYRPKPLKADIGAVIIPCPEESTPPEKGKMEDISAHLEIQYLLYKLGRDMGIDVWVARNDRGRIINSSKFGELTGIRENLPLSFDQATNRTIELIDVLWIEKNSILAAFEIESTTSIYSGLLRMSDLLAMQPNINIQLYIAAPDDRREKVISEVNRPTFSKLDPPLSQVCNYIPFGSLRDFAKQHADVIHAMKPSAFLDIISETCELNEE